MSQSKAKSVYQEPYKLFKGRQYKSKGKVPLLN